MAAANRKFKTTEVTHEGAPAIRISPVQQLERSVMSCLLWEDTFYESGVAIAERIRDLVALCPAEEVARIAISAKQDMRLRHVPLLLARELARTKEGRKQLKNIIPQVITRADDIPELLSIYFLDKKVNRAPAKLPNQLKKHLGAAFSKFDEYALGKYRKQGKTVSLRDALRLTHPKPLNIGQSELWKKLKDGTLATPDTWEVELSKSTDKKASWTRLLTEDRLGGLALLRNIRNMRGAGVEDQLIKDGIGKIQAGRLLPINFVAAAAHNPQFEPQIEKKFYECFANKEKIAGATVILVDISGSMEDKLSGRSELRRMDVAASLAMIGREMFEDLRVFTFANEVTEIAARRGFALRDAIVDGEHGGTNLGAAIGAMPRDCRLIVITDEQSHDAVPQRKGYMINVASNKNGVGYHQWVHIDGWSDRVLSFIMKYDAA